MSAHPATGGEEGTPAGAIRPRWATFVGRLWGLAMRMEASTWRRRVSGLETLEALIESGERVLVVLWHGEYRAVLACVRHLPVTVVSTDTFRGRIIETAVASLGHRCVLRPTDLHGDRAIEWTLRALRDAPRIALVADGPTGPARRVKRGVVRLASRLGLRVVPCGAASRWAYRRNRWDAQEVPVPLSRVCVRFGRPLPELPAPLGDADTAEWRDRIGRAIEDCRREAIECRDGAGAANASAAPTPEAEERPLPVRSAPR